MDPTDPVFEEKQNKKNDFEIYVNDYTNNRSKFNNRKVTKRTALKSVRKQFILIPYTCKHLLKPKMPECSVARI